MPSMMGSIVISASVFMMHNLWTIQNEQAKQNETISFFKNLALAGAALIIFVMVGTGVDFGQSIIEGLFNL